MDLPRKSTSNRNVISRPSVHSYVRVSLDPKLFGEKSYQFLMQKEIIQFFQEKCPDMQITIKQLQNPNTKEYLMVFTTLMRMIDPLYELAGKIEEEIPPLLKSLGYPYTVSKNSLLAVGAPNSWPSLLASLSWLVDSIKVGELKISEPNKNPSHEIAIRAYEMFLSTADFSEELNEMINLLEKNFEKNSEKVQELWNNIKWATEEKEGLVKMKNRFESADMTISKTKSQIFNIKSIGASYLTTIKELEDKLNYFLSENERTKKEYDELCLKNTELSKIILEQEYSVEYMQKVRNDILGLEQSCSTLESFIKSTREARVNGGKITSELESEYFGLYEKIITICESYSYIKEQLGECFDPMAMQKPMLSQENLIQLLHQRISEIHVPTLNHIHTQITKVKEDTAELMDKIRSLSVLESELELSIQEQSRKLEEDLTKERYRKTFLLSVCETKNQELMSNEDQARTYQKSLEDKRIQKQKSEGLIENFKREVAKLREQYNAKVAESNLQIEEAFQHCIKLVGSVEGLKSAIRDFMVQQKKEVDDMYHEYLEKNRL